MKFKISATSIDPKTCVGFYNSNKQFLFCKKTIAYKYLLGDSDYNNTSDDFQTIFSPKQFHLFDLQKNAHISLIKKKHNIGMDAKSIQTMQKNKINTENDKINIGLENVQTQLNDLSINEQTEQKKLPMDMIYCCSNGLNILKSYNIEDDDFWEDDQNVQNALDFNVMLIQYVKNPLEKYQFKCATSNGISIFFFKDKIQNNEIYEKSVQSNGLSLQFVPEIVQNQSICRDAVVQNISSIVFCKLYDKSLWEYTLQKNGLFLYFHSSLKFKEQNDLCEMALRQNGLALRYVKNKTPFLCDVAICQNVMALSFVPDSIKTDKMCWYCIRRNPRTIQFIKDAIDDMIEWACVKDEFCYVLCGKQKLDLCKKMFDQNPKLFDYFDENTQKSIQSYNK